MRTKKEIEEVFKNRKALLSDDLDMSSKKIILTWIDALGWVLGLWGLSDIPLIKYKMYRYDSVSGHLIEEETKRNENHTP